MPFCWFSPTSKICQSVLRFRLWRSLLSSIQNAMNAAEITDKLGLHSLRQRAWVSQFVALPNSESPTNFSTVHPIYLRHIRRWSLRGFGMARKLAPKGWSPVNLWRHSSFDHDCVLQVSSEQSNVHITNLFSISVMGAPRESNLVSSAV